MLKDGVILIDIPPGRSGKSYAERVTAYGKVSSALALLSSRRLCRLVDESPRIGSGIGGSSVAMDVEGTPVFVKQVPLTDLERKPENYMSTANVFGLPPHVHYGVGSAGAGVWRELAAHIMATAWVLGRQSENFPLMYHWRVLDRPPVTIPDEAELLRTVEYWGGSTAIRERLEGLAVSSATVALFLEHIPHNLHLWLRDAIGGDRPAEESAAYAMVERNLRSSVSYMNSRGLLHFDAHFMNVLTDGTRLYLSDFGLALSDRFDLDAAESRFFDGHLTHDGCYTMTQLVNWLVPSMETKARNEYIREVAEGKDPFELRASDAAIVKRYAPVAVVINDFYWELFGTSRATPYPLAKIQKACVAARFDPILTVDANTMERTSRN